MVPKFPTWPVFEEEHISEVERVLRSGKVNYWTGPECQEFEAEYAAHCDCKHAISLANGTLALELALFALEIGPGDEVIVPSRTFIATASCAIARGATPVVADVDRDRLTISVDSVARHITSKTKAIIPVHYGGMPADMDPLMELAQRHKLFVIEDCAQAHGARYKGRPVGGIGDIGVFSFCQDKIITTGGEGGLFVTNNTAWWKRAWAYKDHGKAYDRMFNMQHPPGYRWNHEIFGSNFRLTEMQAALGRVSLRHLDSWVQRRRENAGILLEAFREIPLLRQQIVPDNYFHSYYKFDLFVRLEMLNHGWTRQRIVDELVAAGVPCSVGGCAEIYREDAFTAIGLGRKDRLPNAQELGESSIVFLVHPTLRPEHMHEIVKLSRPIFAAVSRAEIADTKQRNVA